MHTTTIRFKEEKALKLIDKAAKIKGLSRSAFILSTMQEEAEKIIRKDEKPSYRISLTDDWSVSPAMASALIKTLLQKPIPKKTLKKLSALYKGEDDHKK
jgi:uncharacterized protein (DUF1778 family)